MAMAPAMTNAVIARGRPSTSAPENTSTAIEIDIEIDPTVIAIAAKVSTKSCRRLNAFGSSKPGPNIVSPIGEQRNAALQEIESQLGNGEDTA